VHLAEQHLPSETLSQSWPVLLLGVRSAVWGICLAVRTQMPLLNQGTRQRGLGHDGFLRLHLAIPEFSQDDT
jgi:hypothetical protein